MNLGDCRRPRSASARITSAPGPRPASWQRSPSPTSVTPSVSPRHASPRPIAILSLARSGHPHLAALYVCCDVNLPLSVCAVSHPAACAPETKRTAQERPWTHGPCGTWLAISLHHDSPCAELQFRLSSTTSRLLDHPDSRPSRLHTQQAPQNILRSRFARCKLVWLH